METDHNKRQRVVEQSESGGVGVGSGSGSGGRNILFGVVNSEESIRAVGFGVNHLRPLDKSDRILLCHIWEDPNKSSYSSLLSQCGMGGGALSESTMQSLVTKVLRDANLIVERCKYEQCAGTEATVESMVVRGTPKEMLIEFCQPDKVDLVVLGCRPRSTLEKIYLGSVSAYMARNSRVPVLVHKNEQDHNTTSKPHGGSYVVGVDGSRQSEAAFNFLLSHFLKPGDKVHLVTAFTPIEKQSSVKLFVAIGAWALTDEDAEEFNDDINAVALRFLENLLRRLPFGVEGTVEVASGDPRDIIIDRAEKMKACMVVTGSRGIGVVKRAVLGSVSEHLVQYCPHSVLVVPGALASPSISQGTSLGASLSHSSSSSS